MEVNKDTVKQALLERIDIYVKTVKEELEKCGFRCVLNPDYVRITKGESLTEAFSFKADLKFDEHYNGLLDMVNHDQELGEKLADVVMLIDALDSTYLDGFDDTESYNVIREEEKKLDETVGSYFASIEEKQEDISPIRQIYEDMVLEFNNGKGFKYELIRDNRISQDVGFGHGYRTRLTFLVSNTSYSGRRTEQYVFNHTMLIADYVVLSEKTLEFAKANGLNRDGIFGLLRFAYFSSAVDIAIKHGCVTDSLDDRKGLAEVSNIVVCKARKDRVIDDYFKEVIGSFWCTDPNVVELNMSYGDKER